MKTPPIKKYFNGKGYKLLSFGFRAKNDATLSAKALKELGFYSQVVPVSASKNEEKSYAVYYRESKSKRK